MDLVDDQFHIQLRYIEIAKNSTGHIVDFEKNEFEVNLREETIKEFGVQYLEGSVFFNGKTIDTKCIREVHLLRTSGEIRVTKLNYALSGYSGIKVDDVTRCYISRKLSKDIEKPISQPNNHHSRNIFIVHGKDDVSKLQLASILRDLNFAPIILSEQPDKGRTIIEKLENESLAIGYTFVILTPDDPVRNEGETFLNGKSLEFRARQNVILELGYFVGKIGRNRVCCLYKGNLELPSDIHGVVYKKFESSVTDCYKGILDELKAAGYEIKI